MEQRHRQVAEAWWASAFLLAPAGLVFLMLFLVPLGWMMAVSFDPPHWTVALYARLAGDAYYLATLGRTVLLGSLVAAATTMLGVPLAWSIARLPKRRGTMLLALVTMPLWTNGVVRSFAWIVLLGRQGIVSRALAEAGLPTPRLLQTLPAVVVALTQVLLPLVVLVLYGAIRGIDPQLEAAARTLGATRLRAALQTTLPLARPAILSAAALAFAISAGAFVTPALIGGARVHVVAVTIYERMVQLNDWPFAAALSVVLLATVLAVLFAQQRVALRA